MSHVLISKPEITEKMCNLGNVKDINCCDKMNSLDAKDKLDIQGRKLYKLINGHTQGKNEKGYNNLENNFMENFEVAKNLCEMYKSDIDKDKFNGQLKSDQLGVRSDSNILSTKGIEEESGKSNHCQMENTNKCTIKQDCSRLFKDSNIVDTSELLENLFKKPQCIDEVTQEFLPVLAVESTSCDVLKDVEESHSCDDISLLGNISVEIKKSEEHCTELQDDIGVNIGKKMDNKEHISINKSENIVSSRNIPISLSNSKDDSGNTDEKVYKNRRMLNNTEQESPEEIERKVREQIEKVKEQLRLSGQSEQSKAKRQTRDKREKSISVEIKVEKPETIEEQIRRHIQAQIQMLKDSPGDRLPYLSQSLCNPDEEANRMNWSRQTEENLLVEINPLELLSNLIEEDFKSDNSFFPTHFLLDDTPREQRHDTGNIISPEVLQPPSYITQQPIINGLTYTPGVFQCTMCREAFKYQYLLAAHRKNVHNVGPPAKNRYSDNYVNIPMSFKCHICNNEFTNLPDCKHHVQGHSALYTQFCTVCGHAFKDQQSLLMHMGDHELKTREAQVEPVIPAQSISTSLLASSDMPQTTKCECCGVDFQCKAELTRHIVKYQGTCDPNKKGEDFNCGICKASHQSLEDLKNHRVRAHPDDPGSKEGRKGFGCDYCGKTFGCRSNLRDHLVVHTGEKPYPCEVCGKTFSFIHNMRTHRLTHNQGRQESCPYCDRRYKSKVSLYYHMKKGNCRGLATREVPEGFKRCTDCLLIFANDERFTKHKRRGGCRIAYRCTNCGTKCPSQERLNKHMERCLQVDTVPKQKSELDKSIPASEESIPKRVGSSSKTNTKMKQSEKAKASKLKAKLRAKVKAKKEHAKRERKKIRMIKEQECERCNYSQRDCCCTFSCSACFKRIFSFGAYVEHNLKVCPVIKLRKEQERRDSKAANAKNSSRSVDGSSGSGSVMESLIESSFLEDSKNEC